MASSRAEQELARRLDIARHRQEHLPVHRVERPRLRGVRSRWFASGLTLGILVGIFLTLLASALVVTRFPGVTRGFTTQPDIAVVIGEAYLNREADKQIGGGFDTGVPALTLTQLDIDIDAANHMNLQHTFKVDVGFFNFNLYSRVNNQLTVENGALVLYMLGDPQIGDLNLNLNLLPIDLRGSVREAINRTNNEMLIAQINRSLQSGFGGSDFYIEGVTTDQTSIIVRMRQR